MASYDFDKIAKKAGVESSFHAKETLIKWAFYKR